MIEESMNELLEKIDSLIKENNDLRNCLSQISAKVDGRRTEKEIHGKVSKKLPKPTEKMSDFLSENTAPEVGKTRSPRKQRELPPPKGEKAIKQAFHNFNYWQRKKGKPELNMESWKALRGID